LIIGTVTTLVMVISLCLSLGVAAIFWVPLLFMAGIAMLTVWKARRRRQLFEHRDIREVKDPLHTARSWPTQGVVDDRLPEP
jgi:hypothetical protein